MDTTLITETAIITTAVLAGIKTGGELALKRADQKAAARIAQSRALVDRLLAGRPEMPELPQDTAGAADTAPAPAGIPSQPRVKGQFARPDGSNAFIDTIREQALTGQNGAGS